jgi:hypothetical protein
LSFCSWIILFNMIISSFIHFPTNDIIPFFMAEYYSIVYMYHIPFIHSSVFGHVVWFHSLAIVNSAAINMGVQVSVLFVDLTVLWIGYMPKSGVAASYSSAIFKFMSNFSGDFHSCCTNLYSHLQCLKVLFSPPLHLTSIYCCLLDGSHSNWDEMES